jgi:hypothetical protein
MESRSRRIAGALALAAGLLFGGQAMAAIGLPPVPARAQLPTTARAWSAAARRDVEAGYRLFADNHPGMFNAQDPGFPVRLRAARRRGLALAARAQDAAGFSAALDGFSAVLRDGHAQLIANLPKSATPERWPGFVAVWRGDRLRVFASALHGLPAGAEVLGCDGRDVRNLVRSNVFAFGGDPDVAGQWWARAGDLFVDDENPFVRPPRRCRMRAGGRAFDLALRWRPVDAGFHAWREASDGEVLAPGLTEPRPKLFWLALPTFSPDDAERTALQGAFETVRRRRGEILAADAVVIDLRGNEGGSSFWSQAAAKALWGEKAVDGALTADPSQVWWRASPANTRYVAGLAPQVGASGQPEAAAWIDRAATGMKAALAVGRPYWIEPPDAAPATPADDAPPLKTPVYVITPGQCASACLDALDLITALPNTRLIGAPTSADTVYLEVRIEALPDGVAMAAVPNKLYRDRPRRSGQGYGPAIEVDDLGWTTAAFRAAVEADLRARTAAQDAGRNSAVSK